MITITSEERDTLLENFPNLNIVRTMKQDSKRHHYYCEEQPAAMRFLYHLRRQGIMEIHR